MSDVFAGGPKAPKDPTKKQPGFYIMRNKEIVAMPQPDGRGMCPIYESDGRLLSAAGLVGNIKDNEIIELLKTTEGFRKLVSKIGVCIEEENTSDICHFVFQMYGKKDLYGGGANIRLDVKTDGMEYLADLNDVEWREDDDVPGQIRFEFDKAGAKANVSVKLYLNDGFTAPEPEEEYPVDFESEDYKKIIEKSLFYKGNNARIKRALCKARNGEQTTVAFLGGSITQGAGAVPINTECYAYKTFEGFCKIAGKGTDENIQYIKAGVGGTPSEYGMLRYRRDILDECVGEGPDLVVVEFAVNDEGDETKGECFDSLIRKIYEGPGKPAVIIEFAVFANDWNLQDRLKPVGYAYEIPMASAFDSVVDQFKLKFGEGRVLSKSQYFYDMFHPTNIGHRIMADGIINLIKKADEAEADEPIDSLADIAAPMGKEFENVELLDRQVNNCGAIIAEGDFDKTDDVIQCVERNMDMAVTPQLPYNWMYRGSEQVGGRPFTMDVECSALLLIFKDSADNKDGKAKVYVDGEYVLTADPRLVGWTHCDPVIILRGAKKQKHHVEVVMEEDQTARDFTILGFGVVQ